MLRHNVPVHYFVLKRVTVQSSMCLCVLKIKFVYAEQIEIGKFNNKLYTNLSPPNNFTIGFIDSKCSGQKPHPKHVGAVNPIMQLVGEILVYARQMHRKCMISN